MMQSLKEKSDSPYVEIELIKGVNIPVRDITRKSDPYIIFKCGTASAKSSTKYQTLNPVWNELILLEVPEIVLKDKALIEVNVWDWDPLKSHDFCGQALFSLKDADKDKKVSKSLKLDSESGTIELIVTARNFSGSQTTFESFLTNVQDPMGAVMRKLEKSLYASQFKSKDDMQKFAAILSDPERLKATYLSTKWSETMKMDNDLKSEEDIDDERLIDTATQQLKQDVKIKIIVVDQDAKSQFKQNLRLLLSPVLSSISVGPSMGMFHTALVIGPWLIEWNNSALCIPRKCVSRAALISADVDAISTVKSLDSIVDKLANTIAGWNASKEYKTSGGNKSTVGNCQDFIDSVLNAIGIKMEFQGPLAEFLKGIKETGTTKLEFKMSQEFRDKFKIQEKAKSFDTHKDLDQFVHYLMEKDPEFDKRYKHEFGFLKSFDRAFWMRFFKISEEIEKINVKLDRMDKIMQQQRSSLSDSEVSGALKEIEKVKKEKISLQVELERVSPFTQSVVDEEDGKSYQEDSCPFKDPRETKSIIF